MKINKKSNIGIQTFFMIFMAILMVTIIIFGYNKLVLTNKVISENELIQIKKEIKIAVEFCEDPLNRGSQKTIEIKNPAFNTICILGKKINTNSEKFNNIEDFKTIYNSGKNIILVKSNLIKNGNNYFLDPLNSQIIDSFNVQVDTKGNSICWNDENTGKLNLKLDCT